MSFHWQTCPHCFIKYEYYRGTRPAIVPRCPHCGAGADGSAPYSDGTFHEPRDRETKEYYNESH